MAFDQRKILENAQKFLVKGQVRKAISEYEKLVAMDTRNVRIRSKLADLYVRNNDIDRAVKEYVQLAKQYEDEDLSYRAISMFKKVLTIRPKMIDVHYWLADLYKKEGLFGNAKVLYQNIIKINPEDRVARKAISQIDQTRVGAVSFHEQGELQPQPENHILQNNQPIMEEPMTTEEMLDIDEPSSERISRDEEIIDLEEPLELSTENQDSVADRHQNNGDISHLTHQKVDLDETVSPEKDLEAHYHLGIAYMEMDLIDKAIAEFEAALGYRPKQIDCLVMLGHCYTEKGVLDRSIFYLEKAAQREDLSQEESIRINRQLGKVYEACGMKEKAWQAYKRAGVTRNS